MASITTFGTLKSQALDILGREPADHIYQVVTQEINSELRLSCMEETTTVTEAASVDLSAVSPEIQRIISIYRNASPRTPLLQVTPQALWNHYETSGTPRRFAFVDDTLLLDRPGTGASLEIRYVGELDLFSNSGDTNDVLITYPDIYLYGVLYHHGISIGDSRAGDWGQQYASAKRRAKARNIADHNSLAPMIPRRQGMTP